MNILPTSFSQSVMYVTVPLPTSIYAPPASLGGLKLTWENKFRNSQYGPRTELVREISVQDILLLQSFEKINVSVTLRVLRMSMNFAQVTLGTKRVLKMLVCFFLQLHDYNLKLDGEGGWEFKKIENKDLVWNCALQSKACVWSIMLRNFSVCNLLESALLLKVSLYKVALDFKLFFKNSICIGQTEQLK